MSQRGFATLEVILMVTVIAILASIAVPRFSSITTSANTARVQSDLSTLDTAAAIYAMDKGTETDPLEIKTHLKPYLQDAENIKPPLGDVYLDSSTDATNGKLTITDSMDYVVSKDSNGDYRATLKGHTAGEFKQST